MNYKKRYKEALERARTIHDAGFSTYKATMEEVFPELAESEDEKIRRWIVNDIKAHHHSLDEENVDIVDLALAWLEKKGEQEIKEKPIWKHWKDGIAGNGDGKQIYLIKSGDSYTFSSCLGYECEYIELSELDKMLSEKQYEQNPIWSDEDEKIRKELLIYLDWLEGKKGCAPRGEYFIKDMVAWLEKQKPEGNQRARYIEKTKEFLNNNLDRYDESIGLTKDEFINEFINFTNQDL